MIKTMRSLWRAFVLWCKTIPSKRIVLDLEYFQSINWGEVDIYLQWFKEHFDRHKDKSIVIRKSYSVSVNSHFINVEEQNQYLEQLLEAIRAGGYLSDTVKRKIRANRSMYLFDYLQSNRKTHPDIDWLLNHQLNLIRELEYALILAQQQAPEKHAYYLRLYEPHVKQIREFWISVIRLLTFSNLESPQGVR